MRHDPTELATLRSVDQFQSLAHRSLRFVRACVIPAGTSSGAYGSLSRGTACRTPVAYGFAGIPPDDLLAAQVRLPASSVVLHNGTVVAHLGIARSALPSYRAPGHAAARAKQNGQLPKELAVLCHGRDETTGSRRQCSKGGQATLSHRVTAYDTSSRPSVSGTLHCSAIASAMPWKVRLRSRQRSGPGGIKWIRSHCARCAGVIFFLALLV